MTDDATTTGRLLQIALVALTGASAVAAALLTAYLRRQAQASKWNLALLRLWELVQSTVAQAEAVTRPTLGRMLADGRLSPEERKQLKAEVLQAVMSALGEQGVKQLQAIFGTGAVTSYVSGLIERAVRLQRVAGALPPPAPAATPPTPPAPIVGP